LRRWVGLLSTVLALGLFAGACGGEAGQGGRPVGAEEERSVAAGETPAGRPTISIAVNPWTGSAVNANIAKVILERELGYNVELLPIDENAQFSALWGGRLDATLEVWPSGHRQDILRYIEGRTGGPVRGGGGGVVDGGPLGVVGDIGWWVPTYMLTDDPELATWRGLKGHEQLFATPESDGHGRFLAGDPSFVSYDREIIKSLGLDLEVTYAGSEAALLDALDAAFKKQDPLLMYFWTPHWAHDRYDLTQLKLPPFDADCAASLRERDGKGYDCDYADDVLFKAFSASLEKRSPAAFDFLSNFRYTNDDQEEVAYLVDAKGVDVAKAARRWVDGNQDVWRSWLP
jgi:glycine betaine/proline transport system substrate-binding protein